MVCQGSDIPKWNNRLRGLGYHLELAEFGFASQWCVSLLLQDLVYWFVSVDDNKNICLSNAI